MTLIRSALWSNRSFRSLWLSQSVSAFGLRIATLGLALVAVTVLDASAFEVGLIATFSTLPDLLLGLFAGVWVDRADRRFVMTVASVGRAVALASIPVAWYFGVLTVAHLIVVGTFMGACAVFFDVANNSFLPALVDRKLVAEGNGKLQTVNALAQVAGPSVGGLLVSWLTAPFALAVSAFAFIGSAVSVRRIAVAPSSAKDGEAAPALQVSFWARLSEGFKVLLANQILRSLAVSGVIFMLAGSILVTLLPLYATKTLALSAHTLGLAYSAGGVGALVGSALSSRLVARLGYGTTLVYPSLVMSLGASLLPIASYVPSGAAFLVAASQFVISACTPVFIVASTTFRQLMVGMEVLGRVTAINRVLLRGVAPVGSLVGGALGALTGLTTTMAVAAAGMLCSFAWLLLSGVHRAQIPDAVEV